MRIADMVSREITLLPMAAKMATILALARFLSDDDTDIRSMRDLLVALLVISGFVLMSNPQLLRLK